jgi:hypothetical protein
MAAAEPAAAPQLTSPPMTGCRMVSLGEIIALDRTVLTERVAKLSGAKVELLLSRLDVDTRP